MTTFKRYTGTDWEYINLPTFNSGPAATIGYAQVLANQTTISAEVDLTGLAVTVVVPDGRRIKISAQVQVQSATTSGTVLLRTKEGATTLQTAQENYNTTGGNGKVLQSEVIISPTAGSHTYKLTLQGTAGTIDMTASAGVVAFILVEDVTGSTLPYNAASVPVGQLAYAQAVANQGTFTAETDLTGLSVNVSVPAGRVIRISGHAEMSSSVADGAMRLSIFEGATLLNIDEQNGSTNSQGLNVSVIISPSAGAHTYKLSGLRSAGTGNLTMQAGATFPAYILVEDITPTPAAGIGAPGSTLAYAETPTSQAGITTEIDMTGLSVNVVVPSGRRLKITGYVGSWAAAVANDRAILSIKEGATLLNRVISAETDTSPGNTSAGTTVMAIVTPTAGSHTYKLTAAQADAGAMTATAAATFPNFIIVEDITGALWPVGTPVTAGLFSSEAWIDWTPTLTNLTLGNGTIIAKYMKLGRTVFYRFTFTLGTTSTIGTNPTISPPVPIAASYAGAGADAIGDATLFDSGTNNFHGQVWISSGNLNPIVRRADATYVNSALITSTVPFTWGTADVLGMSGTYEAVS